MVMPYGNAFLKVLHPNDCHKHQLFCNEDSPAVPKQNNIEQLWNMTPKNKAYFESKKEAIHLILTGIGDEIYSTVDACQTAQEMWEAIERLQQGESLNIQDVKTNLFWEFGQFTSHDGETIESYYTRFYKIMNEMIRNNLTVATMQVKVSISSTSSTRECTKDKDMQKNLALIAKYFKKLYKPTNNNLRTSSNTRNKNVDTTPRYKNDNQTGQFRNQRAVNVVRARETVGGPVVQQSGIQCFNCKEFGHLCKEMQTKSKRSNLTAQQTRLKTLMKQELEAHYVTWQRFSRDEITEITMLISSNCQELTVSQKLSEQTEFAPFLNVLMTSVPISSSLVLHQMTSDHNRSELGIHDHSNEQSSSKLVPKVVVRLGINPMIQPESEDLPKDNPKLEIAVLRNKGSKQRSHPHNLMAGNRSIHMLSEHPSDTNVFTMKMEILLEPASNKLLVVITGSYIQQHESVNDAYLEEQGDTNITIDSLDMSTHQETVDQDDDDLANERDLLASLIEKLKCEIVDNKNRNKFLESSNKDLVDKLKGEIEDFKTKNKSLETSNNHFKEANNELSKTNQWMFKDLKKFQAELDRTKMPMVVPISTREPKRTVNQSAETPLKRTVAAESTNQKPRSTIRKQYEHISKLCRWWYYKITPPRYKWKPKSRIMNVEPNVNMHLGTKSRTANISEPATLRKSIVSNTPSSSNSFAARRDNFIHRRLWVLKAHDGKSQASKLKQLQSAYLLRLFTVIPSTCRKTPFQSSTWPGEKPSVKFLQIFGSLCYIVRYGENLDKMKEQGDACIFVGYSTQSRAYRLLTGTTQLCSMSSAVTIADAPNQRQQQHTTPSTSTTVVADTPPLNIQTTPETTIQAPTQGPTVANNENIIQAETNKEYAQVDKDEFINIFSTPTKDHPLEQVIGNPSQSIRTRRQLETDGEMCMFTLTVSRTKLKNIKEALADSEWIKAMQEELYQFDRLDVWELVDRPLYKNVTNMKWLWKNKRDEENTVIRNKARLVAKGYNQQE
ncbi:gag-pol polyprotein [Tanacetum coccineum]